MDQINRIYELVEQLNLASDSYYGGMDEIMSNYEWDQMFDELARLEDETGFILHNSPTQHVSQSAKIISGEKEIHEFPALSLAKTKNIEDLQQWASSYNIWVSWKLDGLTLVLTYDKGSLSKILTRGDGTIGTNITYFKNAIRGIPQHIPYRGHLVVRGEAIISYSDFEYINEMLEDEDDRYANPRNLASGTLALDAAKSKTVYDRRITFIAFSLVDISESITSWGSRMDFLDKMGFSTVVREMVIADQLPQIVQKWTHLVEQNSVDFPVDGLVICYDDTEYAATGSVTGHHASRSGLAFKWQDSVATTKLDHIEWSCAISNITPVAVFAPVQLEGTVVSRASLCNISELERLGIGADGQTTLKIIKANKIIPKCIGVVEANGTYKIPEQCPVCRMSTIIRVNQNSNTKTLHCTNEKCPAKHLQRYVRFVSKKGFDIDGLSIQSLRIFINQGFIREYTDIFKINKFKSQILALDGFGNKSFQRLISAIEEARDVDPVSFIYALNIPLIGTDAAKRIIRTIQFSGFHQHLVLDKGFEDIDGIGPEKSNSIRAWYKNTDNRKVFEELLDEVNIKETAVLSQTAQCTGLTFVITGKVDFFENRAALKSIIEKKGGIVTSTVSSKTSYLINNDVMSLSSKNRHAKELGVPIISEQEFINKFGKE